MSMLCLPNAAARGAGNEQRALLFHCAMRASPFLGQCIIH